MVVHHQRSHGVETKDRARGGVDDTDEITSHKICDVELYTELGLLDHPLLKRRSKELPSKEYITHTHWRT